MQPERTIWTGSSKDGKLVAVRSCGIVILKLDGQGTPTSVLLLKHQNRFDLPKGHLEIGETDQSCEQIPETTSQH